MPSAPQVAALPPHSGNAGLFGGLTHTLTKPDHQQQHIVVHQMQSPGNCPQYVTLPEASHLQSPNRHFTNGSTSMRINGSEQLPQLQYSSGHSVPRVINASEHMTLSTIGSVQINQMPGFSYGLPINANEQNEQLLLNNRRKVSIFDVYKVFPS